ncbi:hypothetical protein LNTAR_04321 [Lentisphaera araneosa HTCC2155]|uniref:Polysaccharide pyruvyl transferase domain-containing protein n=1 Tax=Lentisphaera araneosa HTCC2155 TaxID=313628 RepID=A6DQG3_9BACT|nr:polysaccharide pyruvyl transferase family protein [Lentisphaera araneosa]EDM26044.1 hypothetical protein LNTAR_04321 [Lentisphaera araneosa HTCC2155]
MKAILINSTSTYNHLGCYFTTYGLKKLLNKHHVEIIYELEVNNLNFECCSDLLDSQKDCLLIINGEGTIHDNQPYACALLNFSKKYHNRTLLLNSQLRNMSSNYIQIIKTFLFVQVRTRFDENWCLENNLTNVVYCPDMLFYSGIEKICKNKSKNKWVIYTDSHCVDAAYQIAKMYSNEDYKNKKWINLHYLNPGTAISKFKLTCLNLLKYVYSSKYITKYLNNLSCNYLSSIISDFLNAKVVITGRYHGACLAIALGKPLIYGNSNTSKIKDLCNDFKTGIGLKKFQMLNYDYSDITVDEEYIQQNLNDSYNNLNERLHECLDNIIL